MRSAILACVIGLSLAACASADEPNNSAPARQTFLFLGDSITRAGGYVRLVDAELAKLDAANPPRVINHGRNSETVSNLSEAYHPGRRPCVLARLDAELAETKPDWVVACYGINDGIYHPFNEERYKAYQTGIEALITKAQAVGARVILLTPPPYARSGPFPVDADAAAREKIVVDANDAAEIAAAKDPSKFGYRTPYEYYDDVMARYAAWLLTLNDRTDVWVVDVRTPMLARVNETHGGDPIHPNGVGHGIMAEAFMKQWPTIETQAGAK